MQQIEQSAGKIEITTYVDGFPHRAAVTFFMRERVLMNVSDLHDLRYCIDRYLAQLPDDVK